MMSSCANSTEFGPNGCTAAQSAASGAGVVLSGAQYELCWGAVSAAFCQAAFL
jgi:hypothetical protein